MSDSEDRRNQLPTTVDRHRRRRPGRVVTRASAIMSHCSECMGFDSGGLGSVAESVRQCPAVKCHLWPWRNGPMDPEATEK